MKTLPLILLPAAALAAFLVIYFRRASGRIRGQMNLYESLAARFGLAVSMPKNAAGFTM